jgi:CheY-like chemotaxis protein
MPAESQVGVFAIATASEMTGISVTTLRHWEKTYGVVRPSRTDGGHRLYSQDDIDRLRYLRAKIEGGASPAAAHHLLTERLARLAAVADTATRVGAIMILVAERDPITAELEEYFLRNEGFEVRVVLDGRQAVGEAERLQPDLVVVDIILPGVSGLTVCRELKKNRKTAAIPILVFSVLNMRERSLAAGADEFLLKPLEPFVLIERVKHLLTHASGKTTGKGH